MSLKKEKAAFLSLPRNQQEAIVSASEEAHCYECMTTDWFKAFAISSQKSAPPLIQNMDPRLFEVMLSYGVDWGRALQNRSGDAMPGRIYGNHDAYKNEIDQKDVS